MNTEENFRGVTTSSVIPMDAYDFIRELAKKSRRSVSYIIRVAVLEFLNRKKLGKTFTIPYGRQMASDPEFISRVARAVRQLEAEDSRAVVSGVNPEPKEETTE